MVTIDNNVILFGESGSGKSSIVNMLSVNEHVADTSSGAKGCTFKSQGYGVDILGLPTKLWDTAGLNEGDAGRVPDSEAIIQLYKLLRSLTSGVSLLIFVMRAPRIKAATPANWKLFHEIICQKQVPIIIVITGLELEEDMDGWWVENKDVFQRNGIIPSGIACITAIRGRALKKGGYMFDHEFEESRTKIRELIRLTCLKNPWRVEPAEWFTRVVSTTYQTQYFGLCPPKKTEEEVEVVGNAFRQLVSVCNMPEKYAEELVEKLKGL